jgi:hypothetical protein
MGAVVNSPSPVIGDGRISSCRGDRAGHAIADGGVEGAADGGRERDEDGLVTFTGDAQDAVAVFFAEVGDVQSGGFEDPQSE